MLLKNVGKGRLWDGSVKCCNKRTIWTRFKIGKNWKDVEER